MQLTSLMALCILPLVPTTVWAAGSNEPKSVLTTKHAPQTRQKKHASTSATQRYAKSKPVATNVEALRQARLDKAIQEARIPLPLGVGTLRVTAPDRTNIALNYKGGDGRIQYYKDDLVLVGKPNQPVRLDAQLLSASCRYAIFSLRNDSVYLYSSSFGSGTDKTTVKLKTQFRSFNNRASVKAEIECETAIIIRGKMEFHNIISGFYEDATGRHPLQGQKIVFTAYKNAVSVVQDGNLMNPVMDSLMPATP